MFFLKKIKIFIILIFIILCAPTNVVAKEIKIGKDIFYTKAISLFVKGQKINNLPMEPVFYNDYLLVPTRETFEPLGAYVVYIEQDKTVYIIYNDKIIALEVDNKFAKIDDVEVEMTVPAKIVNDKLLIPLRSVSENLGLEIIWDANKNSAFINESIPLTEVDYKTEPDWPSTDESLPIYDKNPQENTNENLNEDLNQDETFVTDIIMPNNNERQNYLIELNAPVSKFEKSALGDNRLILDFYDTNSKLGNITTTSKNISEIRIGVEPVDGKNKTRIVFDMIKTENVFIILSENRKYVLIHFDESSSNNQKSNNEISYKNNTLKISKQNKNIDLNNIIYFDDYNNLQQTFVLADLYLNTQTININDKYLNNINISNVNNKLHLTIKEKQILATTITEDSDYIYIKFMLPKEKYPKIVVLDPGHGGNDPGTVNEIVFKDTIIKEKDIVLKVVNRVHDLIEKDGDVKSYRTRSDDVFITLMGRADFSNTMGDLFVSVHANAALSTEAKGIETFYYENNQVTEKGISSKKVAENIQKFLLLNTNAKDRGVKTASYFVIKENKYPAVLVEVGFVSNPEEVKKLISDDYIQMLADAVYMGILETFNEYTPKR